MSQKTNRHWKRFNQGLGIIVEIKDFIETAESFKFIFIHLTWNRLIIISALSRKHFVLRFLISDHILKIQSGHTLVPVINNRQEILKDLAEMLQIYPQNKIHQESFYQDNLIIDTSFNN